ncbi:MAG: diguanylate cyclase response regulator [Acidobacteria bacterium]|nr:MAG: diguanylate cyclase response regulator [Acidobacteriota bacterium]
MSNILIADDDPVSCKLLTALLTKWGYAPKVVHDGLSAQRELCKQDAPELAILDWLMPGLDGIQVIKELRATHPVSYTYVLLLTSKGQKKDILEGLEAGADDYLRKPFDAQELHARLRVGSRILELQNRLIKALETTEYRATHDSLTGLYNRAAIMDRFEQEAARCMRADHPLGVIMADVDHFKAINDNYGHLAGDEVLKQLSAHMKSALRPYDSLGRYGGEEFLILAPECGLNEALSIAERIRSSVAKDKLIIDNVEIAVTISVGVSSAQGLGLTVNQLLRSADDALYSAKSNGRNRVECRGAPEVENPDYVPEAQHVGWLAPAKFTPYRAEI